MAPANPHTIIVEHLDPELESWQILEYQTIAKECSSSSHPTTFMLSGLSAVEDITSQLNQPAAKLTTESVEKLYATPDARERVCLLDPKAEKDISPEDGQHFDAYLFGGILGDDPPRDRTADLRKMGFPGRRLGPEQMTTDTAARVTRMVVQEGYTLETIPYIDRPDIDLPSTSSENGGGSSSTESVSMPFKYVRDSHGKPILPDGMMELLAADADKGIMDLL